MVDCCLNFASDLGYFLCVFFAVCLRYGDGAGNTVDENLSIFSIIRMH